MATDNPPEGNLTKSVSGKGHIAYDSYAMTPREAEEIRIQIAEAVQRRDEFYGKLNLSIGDLNEVERLERELVKAQQDVVPTFDKRGAATQFATTRRMKSALSRNSRTAAQMVGALR